MDIPVSLYKELAHQPNIVGVKEASADVTKITRILSQCPDDFYIWTGNDDLIVPSIALGGIGVVSVLSNVCPEETVAMANAALAGDFRTAASIQRRIQPIIEALFSEVNPIPIKYAMKCAGYDCGECRLPLGTLSDKNQAKIRCFFC
jgi:4-hydroxy-tetrahydrodipicolinate synthase